MMLTRTEEIILLSVCRLQSEAFGLSIRRDIEEVTGRKHSVGGIYVPLDRLVDKGFLTTESEDGRSTRLGRPRKKFVVTDSGLRALSEIRSLNVSAWTGLPEAIRGRLQMLLNHTTV